MHILDRVFRLVYEEVFDIKTTGPDMDECIVKRIQNEFQDLKILFSDGEEIPEEGECFTRDDYKYFEKLVGGAKYFRLTGTRPKIRIHKPASICHSRWNSRATYICI